MSTKSDASRQSKEFRCWLIRHEKWNAWVADLLGVSSARASKIMHSGLCSPAQREALKQAGVEPRYLPVATSGRPGLQPKAKMDV
ncbi:hypothetical protein [Maridesulfovibrio sp.]|uniref:hypothetical protein n=1 Tax=Maridesulfovibrio sp. TaxID=2795000 RepID=UPI0029CAA827|nr:hypothetical protein [Maridesulfovibrio sp.]